MIKRKARKMHISSKQKEACKCNWTVFRLRGVIELMGCKDMLAYSSDVQDQANIIKGELENLLVTIREENANHKHS